MTSDQAFMSLRSLELTDDEVQAVLARYARPRRRRAFAPALAFAAALLVAVAVPPTRAEIADAVRAVLNGGSLPGKTVPAAELPEWLRQVRFAPEGKPHVLAEADGQRLLVFRQATGALCFDFGDGIGICDASENDLFADGPVALFGPTGESATGTHKTGRFRLWGLTLASVTRVEVTFADAPPVSVLVDGAFGIALDPASRPQELVAYGDANNRLTTLDLTERWKHRPAL